LIFEPYAVVVLEMQKTFSTHTMERSLFYIGCGRQSNQEGKFQYEDQDHHGPGMETKQFCQNSSAHIFYKISDSDQCHGRRQIVMKEKKADGNSL